MRKIVVSALVILSACSGSGEQPDISISNVNNANATNNNNSQNGDSQCSFNCEPVQFEGGIGYLVSQECNGQLTEGPEFSPTCPDVTVAEAPAESEEFTQSEEPAGLNQDGVI